VRWGLLIVLLSGCSLDAAGLVPDEENPLTDSTVESDSASVDDTTMIFPTDDGVVPDSTSPTDSTSADSVAVDTTVADTFKPDTFVADTFKPDTIVPDTIVDTFDAGCVALPIATPCANLPHYEKLAVLGAAGQTMDGRADDFCDVPFVVFDNSTGIVKDPNPTPAEARTTMTIRAAWSTFGLHLHLAVKDPKVIVTPYSNDNLFEADSVEVYTAGYDALTGAFDGMTKDLGAQQIIIAPTNPEGTVMTRGVYFFSGTRKGSPSIDRWAARNTAEGYEIEMRVPWADLKPSGMPAPTAGKKIALTFAFNNKTDTTKAFSVFQVKPVATPVTGCTQPFCDDRYWCTPTLDP
jgi:hypothetical protein